MFQKIVLGIVLFFAFIIAAFFFLIKVIDFNEYKPRIHKAIKESTGYEVLIRGDITITLSPVGVSISDIEINNPTYHTETPIAKLGSFDVTLDIPSLFKKEIKVKQLSIESLELSMEKIKEDKFNYDLIPLPQKAFEKKSKENNVSLEKEGIFSSLVNVKKVQFNNANISYADLNASNKIIFDDIDLDLNDINYDASKHSIQGLSFVADIHIGKIQYGTSYAVQDISMSLETKNGIATSDSLKYTLFDTPLQGSGKFDLSGKQPKILIKSKIVGLKLTSLSKELWGKEILEGYANGDLKLSFFLGDAYTFKSTLKGFVELYGEDVILKGYDIDKIALAFDPTQKSKGVTFGALISDSIEAFKGGHSQIKEISTKVDIGYSELHLSDVALSTDSHRIAMTGSVNLVDEKLVDIKTALLNPQGCAMFEQKFSGTFAKPSVKLEEATITTLTNVVLSFTTKSKMVHTTAKQSDENCTVFYDGIVKSPQPQPETTQKPME